MKRETSFQKMNRLDLEDGENTIRILPGFGDREDFWMEYELSFSVETLPVINRRQYGLPCPWMEEVDRLYELGDEISKQTADKMRPGKKVGMWVIHRKKGEEEKGPKWWSTSKKVFTSILSWMGDPEYGDITDPEGGFDIVVTKSKAPNGFTDYAVRVKRNPTPVGDANWMAEDLFLKYQPTEASGEDYMRACMKGQGKMFLSNLKDSKPSSPSTTPAAASDEKYWITDAAGGVVGISKRELQVLIDDGKSITDVVMRDGDLEWSTAAALGFKKAEVKAVAPPAPPAPPRPPVKPAAPPTPPKSKIESVPSNEESILKGKLEALKAKKTPTPDAPTPPVAPTSQVAIDLKNELSSKAK